MDAFVIAKRHTSGALVFLGPPLDKAAQGQRVYGSWTRDPQRAVLWLDEHLADLEVRAFAVDGATVLSQSEAIRLAHSGHPRELAHA